MTAASIAREFNYLWPSHPQWCCWQTFPGCSSNCHSLLVPGAIFKLPKIHHDGDNKRPRGFPPHLHGELHFSHLGLRLWGLHHHALLGTLAPEQEWRSATPLQGMWKCVYSPHLEMWKQRSAIWNTYTLWNHWKNSASRLWVTFALWTGMVWTRSSQDWS